MNELYVFMLTFLVVFTVYLIFIYIPNKIRYRKNANIDKQPMEIRLLVNLYKVDLAKTNYKLLLLLICFISAFDIALIVSIVLLIKNIFLEILVGLFITIVLILISYYPVGLYYKLRGKTK